MSPFKRTVIETRRGFVIVVAIAAIALPFITYFAGHNDNRACSSIHNLYKSIDQVIINSSVRIERAYNEGQITKKQYEEAQASNRDARETLRGGDCSD